MKETRRIAVTLLGEQYQLVSDEREDDLRAAARLAESTLCDLQAQARQLSSAQLSLFALLRVSLRASLHEAALDGARGKIEQLTRLIDRTLEEKYLG